MRNILLMAAGLVLVAAGAVGGYTATANTKASIVPLETMRWTPQAPDLPQTVVELWGDRTADGGYGELVRLPPGFDSRLHAHSGDFHGVLVAGTWLHIEEDGTGADTPLKPGSYVMQPGGGMHIDRCTADAECILFLFQDKRADVIWPKTR
jgi:hypothetical protein